jgi:hypothetical protein
MLKFVKIIVSVGLGLAEYPYGHMSSTKKLYGRTGGISGQYRFFAVDFFYALVRRIVPRAHEIRRRCAGPATDFQPWKDGALPVRWINGKGGG